MFLRIHELLVFRTLHYHDMSYIAERMPELFGEKAKPDSLFNFDEAQADKAERLQPEEVDAWLEEKEPVVVDIRSSIAYRMKHLNGAINLPIESFEKLIDSNSPFLQL